MCTREALKTRVAEIPTIIWDSKNGSDTRLDATSRFLIIDTVDSWNIVRSQAHIWRLIKLLWDCNKDEYGHNLEEETLITAHEHPSLFLPFSGPRKLSF